MPASLVSARLMVASLSDHQGCHRFFNALLQKRVAWVPVSRHCQVRGMTGPRATGRYRLLAEAALATRRDKSPGGPLKKRPLSFCPHTLLETGAMPVATSVVIAPFMTSRLSPRPALPDSSCDFS